MMREECDASVSADAELDTDERLFTEFGQFGAGRLDLRVFDQDVFWVDRNGRGHRLHDMSTEYLTNVIADLVRCGDYYRRQFELNALLDEVDAALSGLLSGEMLAFLVGGPAPADVSADVWLEATPLMRALRHQLGMRTDRHRSI